MEPEMHLSKFFALTSAICWVLLGIWIVPFHIYNMWKAKYQPPKMIMVSLGKDQNFKQSSFWQTYYGPESLGAELLRLGTLCSAIFTILCVLKGV